MEYEDIRALSKIVKDLGGSEADLRRVMDDVRKEERKFNESELAELRGMFPSSEPKPDSPLKHIKVVDKNNIAITITVFYDDRYSFNEEYYKMKDRKSLVAKCTGKQVVEIFLRHYEDRVELDQVMKDFEASGLEPAAPEDIVCLSYTIKLLGPMITTVVTLGAYWLDLEGKRHIYRIDYWNGSFERSFFPYSYGWFPGWWFAARRKEPAQNIESENQPKE